MNASEYGQIFNNAIDEFQRNNFDKTESICNDLIQVDSKQPLVYNLLAVVKDQKNELDLAIKYSHIALELSPNNIEYINNLGEFYRKKLDFDKSLEMLNKALKLNKDSYKSLYILANTYKGMGNINEAEVFYKKALQINPNHFDALNHLGLLYLNKEEYELSLDIYNKSLTLFPDDLDIKINLIKSYIGIKDMSRVEYYSRHILNNNPNNLIALKDLFTVLWIDSKKDESLYYYKKYVSMHENSLNKEIYENQELIKILKTKINYIVDSFDLNNFEIDYSRSKISLSNSNITQNNHIVEILIKENIYPDLQLAYHGRDNKNIKVQFFNFFKNYFPKYSPNFNKGKINIGFLVTKFNENIFIKFMSGLLNNLPEKEFNIYVICDSFGWDKMKSILKENMNPIFLELSLIDTSKKILNLNLDILYHWEVGTDCRNYLMSFFRLAPFQCTSIGWPDTTGIDTIDYFISSNLIEIENAQENYTEKLIKFKKLPFNIKRPIIDKENMKILDYFQIEPNKNIYLCGQNLKKIHPDFDILVSGILEKDPNGIIVFVKNRTKNIHDLLSLRIKIRYPEIYSRVLFIEQLIYEDYLSLLTHVTVVLDTLYFGGGNTFYDSFAMNAPVVTFPWNHERGRYTLGCYKQMGIDGLIASSFDEYIELAVKTANDKEFRDKIVKDISENNHKLFNDTEVVQEYIDFFKSVARENK